MRVNKNYLSGMIFLFLGIFVWVMIPYEIAEVDNPFGPRIFPQVVSIIMIVSSLGIFLDEIISKRKKEESEDTVKFSFDKIKLFRFAFVFALMTAYVFLFDIIGFIFSSLIYVILCLIFFQIKKKHWYYYVILVAMVFAIYFFFKLLLNVQLP